MPAQKNTGKPAVDTKPADKAKADRQDLPLKTKSDASNKAAAAKKAAMTPASSN